MAKFAVSQDERLTIVFENYADLQATTRGIVVGLERLLEKYEGSTTGAILTVFDISMIPISKES